MIENPDQAAVVTIRWKPAAQLHVNDVVQVDGAPHTVTSTRLQNVPAEVSVEFAGIAGRRHYPAAAVLAVYRPGRSL